MSRRRGGVRVHGPYEHRRRWRVVIVRPGGKRLCRSFETYEDAQKAIRIAESQADGAVTIGEALEAYERHLRDRGVADATRYNYTNRLRNFFAGVPTLAKVTPAACERLYERLRREKAADTHLATLSRAKAFLAFCVDQGWLRKNPAEGLRGTGRKRKGRPQLRLDEARAYLEACRGAAEGGDVSALAAQLPLVLGLRAAEVAALDARDVDDGGRLLWIAASKTDAGVRRVLVPDELAEPLRAQAVGRVGALWPRPTRYWVHHHVQRLCRAAGVPEVGPHGLRGTHYTLARGAGATADAVASALGQRGTEVGQRHYAAPGLEDELRQRRALKLIDGGRSG